MGANQKSRIRTLCSVLLWNDGPKRSLSSMIANVVSFNIKSPLIVVPVTIKTQTGIRDCKFAVDTGSSFTMIDLGVMENIGYSRVTDSIGTVRTVTASKSETAYEFCLNNIMALGLIRRNFKVISRSLPLGLGIDGLLGLNFFKHKELKINFKLGEISIE